MEKINSHKHQAAAAARSPRLIRGRSGSPATSIPDSSSIFLNRSKSTTKLIKNCRIDQEKFNPNNTQKKVLEDDSTKFLQRSQSKIEVPRRARSASTSPSAWALSPGRVPPQLSMAPVHVPVPKSPIITGKSERGLCSKGRGVSGVLKYFRQKKVSPIQEEEYHQFRIMHDRLLQWRFANARAEVSMGAAQRNAKKKFFNAWARVAMIRKLVVEKRIQVQKLNQKIRLHQIVSSQMYLLKEWERLENKNFEAVGRLARKLSATSTCLPLVQGSKADIIPLLDAMRVATTVMESIEATVTPIEYQVEKTCYLFTELSILLKQQKEQMNKLENILVTVASLEAAERSLRVQRIQMAEADEESKELILSL